MIQHCPSCFDEIVSTIGPEDAEILIIGSQPSDDDLEFHKPFQGRTGRIFRKELRSNADISLSECRQTLLWFHAENKNPSCLDVSMQLLEQEMRGKKYIILVGAQAVKTYAGHGVDQVNGLEVTEYVAPELLSPDAKVIALTNPSIVFVRGIGELKFGLEQIKKVMEV